MKAVVLIFAAILAICYAGTVPNNGGLKQNPELLETAAGGWGYGGGGYGGGGYGGGYGGYGGGYGGGYRGGYGGGYGGFGGGWGR